MRQTFLLVIIFNLAANLTFAQSIERFIRIVGTSKHEFVSNGVKIDLNVSEIPENSRGGVKAMSYDSVHYKFIAALKKIGLNENNIETNNININRNYMSFSKNYSLYANDQKTPEKLASLKLEGVQINSILYTYSKIENQDIENMLLNAIEDAKRKAVNITKETGLKLGKILNIEDTSGGCCGDIKETKETKITKTYNVNITFELKD